VAFQDNELLAGKLVVFEGADGVGKTTLVHAVFDTLRTRGVRCERYSFPGAEEGTIGRLVYELHHRPDAYGVTGITPASLQALHVAAHVDEIQTRILPALRSRVCVLLDRFWWSTWAYGIVAGVPPYVLRSLIRFERCHWGSIKPELILHLVRPRSGPLTSIELEYVRLAMRAQQSGRVVRLETNRSIEDTRDSALQALFRRATSPQSMGHRLADSDSTAK
jgi:dTMP kinase